MPLLEAITVEGYRSFAQPTRLDLAPLTLLYGWNNSGKSSLLRLLPLIADSVAESARQPLELRGVFDKAMTLPDLIWRGRALPAADLGMGLTLHFSADHSPAVAHFQLHYADSQHGIRPHVRALTLRDAQMRELLRAQRQPGDEGAAIEQYELTRPRLAARVQPLPFRGLVPEAGSDLPAALKRLREQLVALRGSVQWLRSVRGPFERYLPDAQADLDVLRPDGSDAADVLRARPELLAAVSRFYEEHFNRHLEIVTTAPRQIGLFLRPRGQAQPQVNLVDSGQGLQQVLPVLIAVERARTQHRQPGQPSLLSIEEGEATLHENAERWLGEYLCRVAADKDPPQLVFETHSRTLLLAVQLAVAKGQLSPERIRIYWVNSQEDGQGFVQPVTLDAAGRPEGTSWPAAAFADSSELARELITTQLRRASKPAR